MQAFKGFDVVFHLAAISNTGQAVRDTHLTTEVNCVGTVNVLDACKEFGAGVVIAGSSLVSAIMHDAYGDDDGTRALDEMDLVAPTESFHPYMTTKLFQEMIARDYARQHDMEVVVFRYGIQYGPRMAPGVVVYNFIENALNDKPLKIDGDGRQWRQYVHVYDIAEAHVAVLDNWDKAVGNTYHLTGPEKVTINDIADAIDKVVPVTIEYGPERTGDTAMKFCTSQAARVDLGWEARISLEDGIAQTVDWYRRQWMQNR